MTEVIVLPGASSAEGIAAGRGATFYAGDLFAGDIFRGNIRAAPPSCSSTPPRAAMAVGMAADLAHDLLFVAGGFTGRAMSTTLAPAPPWPATSSPPTPRRPPPPRINDVAVTNDGAWFTDSLQAQLYFVPVSRAGVPGTTFRTLALSGPAADTSGRVQPQRHPGHAQRQDPDRGPLGQRPALHGQSDHRGQRHHRRGQRAPG